MSDPLGAQVGYSRLAVLRENALHDLAGLRARHADVFAADWRRRAWVLGAIVAGARARRLTASGGSSSRSPVSAPAWGRSPIS